VVAAVQALFDGIDDRDAVVGGIADAAQVVIVNGPVRRALQINCGLGLFGPGWRANRSEEHTSELQSLTNLVCRLLLEQKKFHRTRPRATSGHARSRLRLLYRWRSRLNISSRTAAYRTRSHVALADRCRCRSPGSTSTS